MAQKEIIKVKSISEFHRVKGLPAPAHPLISIIDYGAISCAPKIEAKNWVFDFYQISVKRGINAKLKYGQQQYDFDEGVMFFIAPNQVFGIEPQSGNTAERSGWMLLIHPDFLWNSSLLEKLKRFEFFNYSVNEALFLSVNEEDVLNALIENIRAEYQSKIDEFSQNIIISQIETLLNYSDRFYHRQFITRKISNHQILNAMEKLLNNYFDSEDLMVNGLPTVHYIADRLNISPGYLSSLLKMFTGESAQYHIHEILIRKAKEKLSTTRLSVSEIAFDLGFVHPQSFSKLFKSKTNLSPLEFRQTFN
ncbi:MAG: helix-turn-helix domain-containing protein [Bacteroidetes bacterium]|nr:helix-turn-helix domain-containing protein [Bacteroidota bacterium]